MNWVVKELNLYERFLVLSQLEFRYDLPNRMLNCNTTVPWYECVSFNKTVKSDQGADHVGPLSSLLKHQLHRNDLPNNRVNNLAKVIYTSFCSKGYKPSIKVYKGCTGIWKDVEVNNLNGRNYRCYCTGNQGPEELKMLLSEITVTSKTLTPSIVKCIDNNTWPMLMLNKEIKHLVRLRQKYISLLSIRDGIHSTSIKQTLSNWLTKIDLRVFAVEQTYRSRGDRTPGIDGKTLTAKDLISQLQYLQFNYLKNYKAGPVRRVFIPKGEGKTRPLGIPNIIDRITQNLFVQIIEPLIDPHADRYSFGFRKGRNPHQAIGILSKSLHSKAKSNKKPDDSSKSYFVHTKYVVNIDIERFFETVDHSWLLKNYPFPEKFLFILKDWLESLVIYNKEMEYSVEGFPQGSVIGPSLANFTLNGLEAAAKPTQITTSSLEKQKFEEARGRFHKPGSSKIRKNITSAIVRYADDFVFVVNDLKQSIIISENIDSFLATRGLARNKIKSKTIKWSNNAKFNYLGFTFHYILNKNKRSKVTGQRKHGQHYVRAGLYVYPEKSKVQDFKTKIKEVFKTNLNSSPYRVIKILNPIIRGWGNYFNVGITKTLANLDHFIWRRSWRYLCRKYKKVSKRILTERYYKGTITPYGRAWHFHGIKINSTTDTLKRKGIYAWIVLLVFTGTPIPAQMFAPSKNLIDGNFYIDEQAFTDYNLNIYELRHNKSKYVNKYSLLYKNQNGICPICNQGLGYFNSTDLEIHHLKRVSDTPLGEMKDLNKVENLQLLHKECHKTTLKIKN
jgi:RNA-directed DNA polymerase